VSVPVCAASAAGDALEKKFVKKATLGNFYQGFIN